LAIACTFAVSAGCGSSSEPLGTSATEHDAETDADDAS
jgi:hypothetical protein